MVEGELLQYYGGYVINAGKEEMLFQEGDEANTFYQVNKGCVKMVSYAEDGKAVIQGFFTDGQSFGEPPLFGEFPYPSAAVAVEKSTIWKLPKENFFKMLKENFNLHLKFDKVLSERVYYKANVLKQLSTGDPGQRILALIDYYKEKNVEQQGRFQFRVNFTRQQIADMTGLRVETVIRTIKHLDEVGELKIENHKVFR